MTIIPNFAVFEGGDGSGTTTQLSLLTERLKNNEKIRFFPTFEPTDGHIGKLIRAALKKDTELQPQTIAMLFAADRNEHINKDDGILKHAINGELVVSDRYVLSSLVYQGIECGDELPYNLNSRYPAPETLIFFDVEPEIALKRMKNRASREIYEYLDFQVLVRQKYLSLLDIYRNAGIRVEIIDAGKSAPEVSNQVWSILCTMPIFNEGEKSL
ncbi:MAG: dTMP kinase [Treponema sp.]|nr:dTMP kinase [Treponema sp.]